MAGSSATLSLYDVLGVEQTAPPEALRKAWKRRVLETHPDKLPQDINDEERQDAETQFREVHQAYEILSDPAKRRVYDNGLNYLRGRLRKNEAQERLAKTREEWDRQCKERQEERLRQLREKQAQAKVRYQETFMKAEMRYRERMQKLEEEMNERKEQLRQAAFVAASQMLQTNELLQQLRNANPEWEARRQAALRVSDCTL
ncbi:DnaJ-domain-containing protein [Irpex lacteus]|nr:DnaJ-domain-containing protein [Irpex lacteus]